MKKFDLINVVIGKLAMKVKVSKLTDYQLTKNNLQQGQINELQQRLDNLTYGINKDDKEDNGSAGGRGGGGWGKP